MSDGLKLLASLSENGSVVSFRLLEEDMLVGDEEHTVYDFMRNHYRRYSELPMVETMEEQLSLRFPGTPEHVDYYMQEVHNRYIYNHVRDEFTELRDAVVGTDVDRILQGTTRIRQICTPYSGQQQELVTLAGVTSQIREDYHRAHTSTGLSGIPTGWDFLDRETDGYQNGDLIIDVARPSVGKTHKIIHQAKTAWHNNRSVLFVSMEMPLNRIGMRFASHLCGVDPDKLRKGRLSSFAMRRLEDSLLVMEGAHNFHLFAGNFNKNTSDIDVLIQELSPDIVYIDGLYLLKPTGASNRAGRYERVAYVVDELKTMTLTRDRPIAATTQFAKAAGKGGKDGSMESIGYTDTIATHASIITSTRLGQKTTKPVFDLRPSEDDPEVYTPQVAGYKDHYPHRIVEILKGREGEAGTFAINFKFGPVDFSEVPVHVASGDSEPSEAPNLDHML